MSLTENLQILDYLSAVARTNPTLRFHQLLSVTGVTLYDPREAGDEAGGKPIDLFYEPSLATLERVRKTYLEELS